MNGFLKIELVDGELVDVGGTAVIRKCAFFLVRRYSGFTWYRNIQGVCEVYMDVNISDLTDEEFDIDGGVNEFRMLYEKCAEDHRFIDLYEV